MLWVSGPIKSAKLSQKTGAPKTQTVSGLSSAEISARLDSAATRTTAKAVRAPAMRFQRGHASETRRASQNRESDLGRRFRGKARDADNPIANSLLDPNGP